MIGIEPLAVRNTWLQVTVLATANTGLTQPYVFYFASVAGDTGQGGGDFGFANTTDQSAIRSNPTLGLNTAALDSPLDINRSKKVDANDRLIIRQDPVIGFARVQPITVPGPGGGGGESENVSESSSASVSRAIEAVFAESANDPADQHPHRRLLEARGLRRAALPLRPFASSISLATDRVDAEPGTWPSNRPLGRRNWKDRVALERVFEQLASID